MAAESGSGLFALRSWIESYYYDESVYEFADESLERMFGILCNHLDEHIEGGRRLAAQLTEAANVLRSDCTVEALIYAIERARISSWRDRFAAGRMSEHVYVRKLSELTPVEFSVRRLRTLADTGAGTHDGG